MATSMTATAGEPVAIEADDEARLIERAQAGDREAFGQLYLRHRPAVLRFLLLAILAPVQGKGAGA